jgi:organic radical activating enzyme
MLFTPEDSQQFDGGNRLPLVEDFYTIQGEGHQVGKPAYFVRIGGCDVGCSWCDTKFSWNPGIHPLVEVKEIVARAMEYPARAVVVTGGEPLMYNMGPLTVALKDHGIQTFLETSGAYPLSGTWNWICLSPKKNMAPDDAIFPAASELKVIISDGSDFEWAEENARLVKPDCLLYLQPEWSRHQQMIQEIVEYVKANPKWNISIQAHKFMHIP